MRDEVTEPAAKAPQAAAIDFENHREILETNLHRQSEAIRSADIKIALLVPTTTVMLGVMAALLRDQEVAPLQLLVASFCLVPLLLAFVLMASGVMPRLRGSPSPSLLFFGDLSAKGAGAARDALLTLTPQAYLADLAAQCHTTASIAQTKYRLVRRAYLAFLVALPFWLVGIWVLGGT
jgi:hypothetical protein